MSLSKGWAVAVALALALAIGTVTTPAAAANLLVNGGFEAAPTSGFGGYRGAANVQPYPGTPVGSQYLPGWTIATPGQSDLHIVPVSYGLYPNVAVEGQQYFALNWSPFGAITLDNTITQGFTLGAGATGFAFDIAMAVESGFAGSTLQATVRDSDGTIVAQSGAFTHLGGNGTWSQKSWAAALQPGTYTLSLRGIGAGNAWDVLLDNAVLTQVGSSAAAVPEPAAWSLMIAGFSLTGAMLRRRPTMRVVVA